jgi:hypothetical protein
LPNPGAQASRFEAAPHAPSAKDAQPPQTHLPQERGGEANGDRTWLEALAAKQEMSFKELSSNLNAALAQIEARLSAQGGHFEDALMEMEARLAACWRNGGRGGRGRERSGGGEREGGETGTLAEGESGALENGEEREGALRVLGQQGGGLANLCGEEEPQKQEEEVQARQEHAFESSPKADTLLTPVLEMSHARQSRQQLTAHTRFEVDLTRPIFPEVNIPYLLYIVYWNSYALLSYSHLSTTGGARSLVISAAQVFPTTHLAAFHQGG